MDKTMEFLWDTWDSEGIVHPLHVIEEKLDGVISFEDHANISQVVERFLSLIRPHEGVILYELPSTVAKGA